MKYTAQQYARALYELIEHNPSKTHETIKRFVEKLHANSQMGLARNIIREFEREWNTKKSIVSVEVVAAQAHTVSKKTLEEMLGTSIELTEKIDPSTGAGIRMRVGNYQVDNTLSRRMLELKKVFAR